MTVAIVSWNTRDLLLRCLRSLARDVEAGRATVWIVDNRSTDGSLEAAGREAPWANVLDAGENIGFGRAANLVARRSRSEWLAVANADVAVEPGALRALLDAGSSPRIGCVAPRLTLPGGETQHSVHPFPTVPVTLAFNLGLQHLSRRLGERLCLEGFWNPDLARAVPWAIGAFLVFRRAAFDEAGGFDERQWLYAEDLDLGWRLDRLGWLTWYEPGARVLHESSAATGAAFGEEQMARFMAATYGALTRRRGVLRAWIIAALNVAGAAARLAIAIPLAIASPRWRDRRDMNRRWLTAHLQGLRSRSALVQRR